MLRHNTPALLLGAALLALPLQGLPETGGPEERLVEKYERFAGSERNARELVEGLRNDSRIELSRGGRTTRFASPTDEMGWGNVDIALSLAKASLEQQGIRNPTPEQIRAALLGGTVRTSSGKSVTLDGVLELRASGMGWGRISQEYGFKLGEVRRPHTDAKPDGKHADFRHERAHVARLDKVERPEKFERPDRPHKVERPEKIERPQKPERPERHGRH